MTPTEARTLAEAQLRYLRPAAELLLCIPGAELSVHRDPGRDSALVLRAMADLLGATVVSSDHERGDLGPGQLLSFVSSLHGVRFVCLTFEPDLMAGVGMMPTEEPQS